MRTERLSPFHPGLPLTDDEPRRTRPVDHPTTTVSGFEPSSRLPPATGLDAVLEREAEAAATWDRLERAHPHLATKLPASCRTPLAKLLFIVSDRALSKETGPLSVPLGATDTIRRTDSGHLELHAPPARRMTLNDQHGDLARLLQGAQAQAAAGLGPFDTHAVSVDALLSTAVRDFHSNPAFTGGGEASSERGGRGFRYATFTQVLVSSDRSQKGFECLASAAFHLYRSMGLVPPDGSRQELERRYTVIHGDDGRGPRLGREFTRSLRGGPARNPGERRFDAEATAEFANRLRETDWAKLTGAANGRYAVRSLSTPEQLVRHFAEGGAGVRTTWADGGHYFVLSGASRQDGVLIVDEDDSLRARTVPRSAGNPRPHQAPYDPTSHTRFWTLERRDTARAPRPAS